MSQIAALEGDLAILVGLNQSIRDKQNQINNNQREIDNLLRKYDVSLQELMAGEDAVLDRPGIKGRISTLIRQNESLDAQVAGLISEREPVIAGMRPVVEKLRAAWNQAIEKYKRQQAFHNLKKFLLKLLFILPLFLLFGWLYFRFKKKDSPYTIILTPIYFAVTVLLLQIVLSFLYDILPKEWLRRIFRLLMNVAALKYLIYYAAVALAIVLLGGVVYLIQRRVYSPARVAARQLKKGKCPRCSLPVDLAEAHCPGCGHLIREECPACGKQRFADLKYCPHCGT